MQAETAPIPWHMERIQDAQIPDFLRRELIPREPVIRECELCDTEDLLQTVLVIDGPDGLPIPFVVCGRCRRTLDELHALLESASERRQG